MTIPEVEKTFDVPVNDYDGKITYGEKMGTKGVVCESHVTQLKPSVELLADFEKMAQTTFLKRSLKTREWQAEQ